MQIVIDISEDAYNYIKANGARIPYYKLTDAIKNGAPLPKGHGRLIDADSIPEQIELKGFLSQDNAHLVTIDRVKEALDNASTIIEAESEGE